MNGPAPRSIAAAALAMWSVFAAAAPAGAEDLAQAWAIAGRVNAQLQAQRLQSVAAGLDLAASKRARLPVLTTRNYDAELSASPTTRASLPAGAAGAGAAASSFMFPVIGPNQTNIPVSINMATLPIYTGGRLLRNIDSADYTLNAQRTEEFRTELDLRLTVAEAYINVLRSRRALETARSNVEQLASFSRDTKNRREQGLAIRSDELAAEVSLANAQLNEIQARTNVETAWATYNRYLCRPLDAVVDLDEVAAIGQDADWTDLAKRAIAANAEIASMGGAEIGDLTNQAVNRRPELANLTNQAKALGAQAESTLSIVKPQVNLSGGLVYVGARNFTPQGIGTAMVNVNWQVTDFGTTRRRAEAIRQRERSTIRRRDDLAADIALAVRTNWLTLQQARLRVPVARVAVTQSEENVRVVNARYRQQLSTYTEVLDAETRRVQALNNFYNAVYDESLAGFRLRRSVGDL